MFSLGSNQTSVKPMAIYQDPDVIAGGYTVIPTKFYHPNASRNALGLVGGNEVSLPSGNLVDVESELRGITRDLSKAPAKKAPAKKTAKKAPAKKAAAKKSPGKKAE